MPITYLDDSPKITYLDEVPSDNTTNPVWDTLKAFTPQGMMTEIPKVANSIANRVGEFATERLGEKGVNPNLSAGIGTLISMAPDLASIAAAPTEVAPEVTQAAVGPMQRALGFSKAMLMNKPAREAAQEAASVALENKVMPMLGSPEGAAANLEKLKETSGAALGQLRESVGSKPIDDVWNSLQKLRQQMTEGGAQGGDWDQLHQAIDTAQQTIIGLRQTGTELGEVGLNKIERAKKVITEGVNYLKQNVTQGTAKRIGGAIEDGIENILEAHGIDMKAYAALKRTFGGAANALKALNSEIAAQAGNQAINPMSVMTATGTLASGNPALVPEAIGATEFLKRRGMGIAANLINATGQQLPGLGYLTSLGLSKAANKLKEKSNEK